MTTLSNAERNGKHPLLFLRLPPGKREYEEFTKICVSEIPSTDRRIPTYGFVDYAIAAAATARYGMGGMGGGACSTTVGRVRRIVFTSRVSRTMAAIKIRIPRRGR